MWIPGYLRTLAETLRAGLNEIKDALKDQKSSIDAAAESYANERRNEPRIVVAPAPSEQERKESNCEKKKDRSIQRLIAGATWTAAVAGIVYGAVAFITYRQIKKSTDIAVCALEQNGKQFTDTLAQMKEQTGISRDALISVQRAFVNPSLNYGTVTDPFSGNPIYMSINIKWENVGVTPTRKLIIHDNSLLGNKLPNVLRDMRNSEPPYGNVEIFLGPKSEVFSRGINLTLPMLESAWKTNLHVYLWGWARYRDVFNDSKPHITRYCHDITIAPLPNQTGRNTGWTTVPHTCPAGNCTDDDCKEQ
jgi:Sec-independent protein translocase protein TatA